MNKIIVVVVGLALIWALPPVRERLAVAAHPVLVKLGPVGEAVIRPAQREAAKKQITSISRVVAAELETGVRPPTGSLQNWIARHLPELTGRDPWDNAYWAEQRGRALIIGSNGPDGQRGTLDDITQAVPF